LLRPLFVHLAGVELLAVEEIRRAVTLALAEDIGSGDVTTLAAVPETAKAKAVMRAREPLVVAGLALAEAAFRAAFVLADAWFGCKENIACCLENKLTALFQMKRGLLAYRYHQRPYTVYPLYGLVQRRMRPANRRARFKTASLVVSLNFGNP
jgi:Quinolinate phosphoribosyl transferase, N-terminal domain